ncbi:MAG: class I SAM-dependent methyltransferase [Myxococcales bacterium]|nr:class I SAM-dependent methyltransferase [Myxococcales bacterium]
MSHDFEATLFDKTFRGSFGDVAFYRRRCRGASSVLELGCGTGRLMLPLAKAGHEVLGIDLDPVVVERGNQKLAELEEQVRSRTSFHLGDMRDFSLGRTVDRILIPYCTFYLLTSDDECLACLERCREHLAPGGQLLLDGFHAWKMRGRQDTIEVPEEQRGDGPIEGRRVQMYASATWDCPKQRYDLRFRYTAELEDGQSETRTEVLRLRYLFQPQIESLLERAGMRAAQWFGGFDERPFDDQSRTIAVVAVAL